MTIDDLIYAFEWLRDNTNIVLPYGEVPGTHNQVTHGDKVNPGQSENEWKKYQWNPPQYHDYHKGIDQKASAKITWQDLLEANEKAQLQRKIELADNIFKYGDYQGKTTDYYKREIVIDTGVKESIVNLAHGYLIDNYREKLASVNDSTKTIAERIKEAESLIYFVNSYPMRLRSWVHTLINQDNN